MVPCAVGRRQTQVAGGEHRQIVGGGFRQIEARQIHARQIQRRREIILAEKSVERMVHGVARSVASHEQKDAQTAHPRSLTHQRFFFSITLGGGLGGALAAWATIRPRLARLSAGGRRAPADTPRRPFVSCFARGSVGEHQAGRGVVGSMLQGAVASATAATGFCARGAAPARHAERLASDWRDASSSGLSAASSLQKSAPPRRRAPCAWPAPPCAPGWSVVARAAPARRRCRVGLVDAVEQLLQVVARRAR